MLKNKKNWIDELERGDMISKGEAGASYAYMGINEEGLYMLCGMPFGYYRETMETFKLIRKKKQDNS